MSEVDKHANENITRILVGNKKDLEDKREIPFNEGKDLADHFNVKFMETSAKEAVNVEKAFFEIARDIKSKIAVNPQGKKNNIEGSTKLNKGASRKL